MIKDFHYIKYKKGFTLLEIMIALSILFIISYLTFFSFKNMNDRQMLIQQVDDIKLILNKSRMNAINSKDLNGNQSVKISTTSIDFDEVDKFFENNIYMYDYTTSTTTITFKRLSGESSVSGIFYFKLEKGGEILATTSISINSLGVVE